MEKHFCEKCNKTYQTSNGLWKHNKKHHVDKEKPIKESICCYCDKKLSDRHSKWRHEQICTHKDKIKNNQIEDINEEITKLKTELEIVKNKPATINNINNIKNINKGIINKGVINYIKPPGSEDINVITEKEAEKILENEMNCLIALVD
jgi:uncharacterized Zn-finger protein